MEDGEQDGGSLRKEDGYWVGDQVSDVQIVLEDCREDK